MIVVHLLTIRRCSSRPLLPFISRALTQRSLAAVRGTEFRNQITGCPRPWSYHGTR